MTEKRTQADSELIEYSNEDDSIWDLFQQIESNLMQDEVDPEIDTWWM